MGSNFKSLLDLHLGWNKFTVFGCLNIILCVWNKLKVVNLIIGILNNN